MNIFQKRIENLCDEIIGRILALMQANSVSEVILTDNDNPVYVIWFDKIGDPCECSVHKVTAVGEGITLEVHDKITGENYKVTSRHEAALANPVWLNDILESITNIFHIKEDNVICCKCGSTNVTCEAMINPNTKDFDHYTDDSFQYGWCDNCKTGVVISDTSEVKKGISQKYKEFTETYNTEPQLALCRIWKLRNNQATIAAMTEDWEKFTAAAQTDQEGNRLNLLRIDGLDSTDEKTIGKRLQEIARNATTGGQYKRVGELYGFPIEVVSERTLKDGLEFCDNRFVVAGNYRYSYNNGHLAMADTHAAAMNFLNALERIPGIIDQYRKKNEVLEREIPQLQEIAGKTWKKEDELKQLKSELAALDRKIQLELAPPTPESSEENLQSNEKKQTEQQPESPHADFVRSHLVVGRPGLTEPRGMKL